MSLLSKSVSHLRVNTSEKKYFFLEKTLISSLSFYPYLQIVNFVCITLSFFILSFSQALKTNQFIFYCYTKRMLARKVMYIFNQKNLFLLFLVFYVFYEQYLTMWSDTLTSLGISLGQSKKYQPRKTNDVLNVSLTLFLVGFRWFYLMT